MKRIIGLLAFILVYFGTVLHTKATHIVGAELYYECINPSINQYRITLKMYRDCFAGQAPFDNPVILFVFSAATGQVVQNINIPIPPMTPTIEPENLDACVASTPDICVEEGVYTTIIQLPPLVGGYDLAWARCCRNAAIDNLAVPLGEGITFLAHVPDPGIATCNSMPQFTQTPPIFLCANESFFFDHSAVDPDGDSLSYSITNPYTGINNQGLGVGNPNQGGPPPVTDPFNNPMGPPPYRNVAFAPGFRFNDPFGSGNFNIDPATGFISVTPNRAGIFVFSISVFEWRNGELMSENRRDFQIHVLNCREQGAPPEITHDISTIPSSNDTIFVEANVPFCYDIDVRDINPMDNLEAYTVSASFGRGTFIPPAATFSWSGTNPLTGQICWQPSCAYDGQIIPLVIGARDVGDCPNISDVFDTVWVNIIAPDNSPPEIIPDYANLTFDNDTIVVSAMNDFCYTFDIVDSNRGERINAYPISSIFDEPNGPTFNYSGINPVQGEICWTPDCDLEGQVVELTFEATDLGRCSSAETVRNTTYIRIEVPPNDPPEIATNLGNLTTSGDTILIDAMQPFCYTFNVSDVNVDDVLQAFEGSPIFSDPNGPSFSITGTNPIQGEICWEPGCEYEDQVVNLIVKAEDAGMCNQAFEVQDTIFVKVNVPPNDPPIITTDLSGLTTIGDTIFVQANQGLCYTFDITDQNIDDTLDVVAVSPIFSGSNAPSFSISGINPVQGEICWTPDCEFSGQVVELEIAAQDNGMCSSVEGARSIIYVSIAPPPNEPPTVVHDLSGLTFSNDTVFTFADEQLCYDVIFSDPDNANTLTVEVLSPVFTNGDATFTPLGTNPVQGQVCWTPSCDFEGQVIPLLIRARDDGECNNILEVVDTVFVNIQVPELTPPIVTSDLTGTTHNEDTIFVSIGDGVCYDFSVQDQTLDTDLDYSFEFQDFGGTDIGLGTVNVQRLNGRIEGEVCFQSDCSNGGSLYRLIITGLDTRNCPPLVESKDTVFIKVNTDFEANAGPDLTFCEGTGGIQLNATQVNGGGAPYYYSWSCTSAPNCGFSNPNAQNPIVNPTGSTTFFLQVTDRFGCTSEIDSISVGVDLLPKVSAGPDVTICEDGESVQLEATVTNTTDSPGPYTYEWFPAEGLSATDIANPIASPTSTTIYTVLVSGSNGCSSITTNLDTASTIEVRVSERPISEAGNDQTICIGESIQLNGFATRGGPNYTFIWSPAEGLDDPTNQNPIATPTQPTTYYLIASSNGCEGIEDSVFVDVKSIPTVNPGSNYEICATEDIQLDGSASGAAGETFTYLWSPDNDISDRFEPVVTLSPDTTTIYTLVATSNYGCRSLPYDVLIDVLPTPKAEAGDDTFICRQDSVMLNGSHTYFGGVNPPGEAIYSWTPATGLSSSNIPNPQASPNQTTVYTLTVSYGSCQTSDQVKVDVFNTIQTNVTSTADEICSSESVQLTATGGTGSAFFSWSPAASLDDPNSSTPFATPDVTTTYYVQIEEGGCQAVDSITVTVNQTPTANFFTSSNMSCAPLEVSFMENTQDAFSYIWDFGDGTMSTDANPSHIYTNPGTYEATLTAFGAGGCNDQVIGQPIVVVPKGIADFTSNPGPGVSAVLPDVLINFQDLSQNASTYSWDFGDGNTSEEQNPAHNYIAAGNYTVTLVITDAGGCIDSASYGVYNIFAPDLFIPNVFSPNQDGINDTFKARYSGKETFYMQVYDRWGVKMFEENGNSASEWDGRTPGGNNAREGVYYYLIKIGDKPYTGNVTLVR